MTNIDWYRPIPNLALDLFLLVFCTLCFRWPAHCFWSMSLFPPLQKTLSKQSFEHTIRSHIICLQKTRNLQKKESNNVPKSNSILGNSTSASLVAPLAPQVIFLHEQCTQGAPKVVPRLQMWLQKGFQSDESESAWLLRLVGLGWPAWLAWLAGLDGKTNKTLGKNKRTNKNKKTTTFPRLPASWIW